MRKFLGWFNFSRAVLPLALGAVVGFGSSANIRAAGPVVPNDYIVTGQARNGNNATATGSAGNVTPRVTNHAETADRSLHFKDTDLVGGPGGIGGNAVDWTAAVTPGGNGGNSGRDDAVITRANVNDYLSVKIDGHLNITGGNGGHNGNNANNGSGGTYSGGLGTEGGDAGVTAHSLSTGGLVNIYAGRDSNAVGGYRGGNGLIMVDHFDAHDTVTVHGVMNVDNNANPTAYGTTISDGKSILHVYDTMIARDLVVDRYDRTLQSLPTPVAPVLANVGGITNVDVSIANLDMRGKSTVLTSIGAAGVITEGASTRLDFFVHNAMLGNGGELIIDDRGATQPNSAGVIDYFATDGPSLEIDTLDVSGLGYLQTLYRNKQSITNMHVTKNGVVSFILPEQYRDGTATMADYTTQLVTVGHLELGGDGSVVSPTFPNTYMTIDTRPDMNGIRPHLGPGDEQWLLHSNSTITPGDLEHLNPSSWTESGHRLDIYAWDLDPQTSTDNIWARVSTTPMVSLSHARLASLAFANWGGDLISGAGMRAATAYNLCPPCPTRGHCIGPDGKKLPCCIRYERCAIVPFVAGQGGSSEYKTGQDMDIDGGTVMGGVAWNKFCCNERLFTVGIFGEGGWGDYNVRDRYLSSVDITSERTAYGKGDTNYYGGGILARYGWNCNPLCGFYVEGSLRAGKIDADYDSTTLAIDNSWTHVDFDGMYYGAHFGTGYGWSWQRDLFFEVSTKFLWTHYEGEDENIRFAQTHRQSFDDMDSYRARVGARLNKVINPCFMPYVGAGWEYEFDGKSTSTYTTAISGQTFTMDSRDLRGGTGMGEIGAMLQPCSNRNFIIDLSGQGYWGVRQGGVAVLALKWVY